MSKDRMLQGKGPPSFCWHCGRMLQRATGKGQGLFYFNLVRDKDGTKYRVHGECTAAVIQSGTEFFSGAKP